MDELSNGGSVAPAKTVNPLTYRQIADHCYAAYLRQWDFAIYTRPSAEVADFGCFFKFSRLVQKWLMTQAGRKTEVDVVLAPARPLPPYWVTIWTASRADFHSRTTYFQADMVCALGDKHSSVTFGLWDVDPAGSAWPAPICAKTAHEVAALYWHHEEWCVRRNLGWLNPRDAEHSVLTTELLEFFQKWPVVPSELKRLAGAMERELFALCRSRGELPSKFETEEATKDTPAIEIGRLSESEERILIALGQIGHRVTTRELLQWLEERYGATSEGTTKQTLAGLGRRRLLNNRQDVDPKGYGLPSWDN